jgi:hypothetical protein
MEELEVKAGNFWRWFVENRKALEKELEGATWRSVQTLEMLIRALHEGLDWEIRAPGTSGCWTFALSPNGHRELLAIAEAIVAKAPDVPGWAFCAGRPPRNWKDGKRRLDYGAIEIDASGFEYVLTKHEGNFDIIWVVPDLSALKGVDSETLANHLVDCELGEKARLKRFRNITLVGSDAIDSDTPDPEAPRHPIEELRAEVVE